MTKIIRPIPTPLIVASRVYSLNVATLPIGRELSDFIVHTSYVAEVTASAGGQVLATVGFDGGGYSASLWDMVVVSR